jgi:hypothetical protein
MQCFSKRVYKIRMIRTSFLVELWSGSFRVDVEDIGVNF